MFVKLRLCAPRYRSRWNPGEGKLRPGQRFFTHAPLPPGSPPTPARGKPRPRSLPPSRRPRSARRSPGPGRDGEQPALGGASRPPRASPPLPRSAAAAPGTLPEAGASAASPPHGNVWGSPWENSPREPPPPSGVSNALWGGGLCRQQPRGFKEKMKFSLMEGRARRLLLKVDKGDKHLGFGKADSEVMVRR